MSEYVRVPVSATHAVDVSISQELIDRDPARAAVVAYLDALTADDLALLPLIRTAPDQTPPDAPEEAFDASPPDDEE